MSRPDGMWMAAWATAALACAAGLSAAEQRLTLDPAASRIRFELPATGHDVEGVFSLENGVIAFDAQTGAASGEITVDAGSGESGNGSRDKTMRNEVLEAASFPEIRFTAQGFRGELPQSGVGEIELVGKISLHGAEHPLTLKTRVTTNGTHVHAETQFPVAYVDWGMKNPSILFLRVEPVVQVKIIAEGELQSGSAAGGA